MRGLRAPCGCRGTWHSWAPVGSLSSTTCSGAVTRILLRGFRSTLFCTPRVGSPRGEHPVFPGPVASNDHTYVGSHPLLSVTFASSGDMQIQVVQALKTIPQMTRSSGTIRLTPQLWVTALQRGALTCWVLCGVKAWPPGTIWRLCNSLPADNFWFFLPLSRDILLPGTECLLWNIPERSRVFCGVSGSSLSARPLSPSRHHTSHLIRISF